MERTGANNTSNMVIFQGLLLNDKRVISKERNAVRASNPRASLTWTDNTSKVGYGINHAHQLESDLPHAVCAFAYA